MKSQSVIGLIFCMSRNIVIGGKHEQKRRTAGCAFAVYPQAERAKIWTFNVGTRIILGFFSQELITTPQNRFFLPFQLKFNPEAAAEERAAFLSNPPLWILCGFKTPELPKTLSAAEDPSGIWNDILTGYECVYSKTGNYREKATVFLLKKK